MARTAFDLALEEIHNDFLRMGSITEKQIYQCIEALVNKDVNLAEQVIKNDDLVDNLEKEIEDKCVKLTAMEQPLATDVRTIFTTFKLVTDLERMADYASDIAMITIRLKDKEYNAYLMDIPKMSETVSNMIKKAIDAFVSKDVNAAYSVSSIDDKIDSMFKSCFANISKIDKSHTKVEQITQLMFVCKYLEKIADHVTNICEGIVYLTIGEQKDLN